MFATVTIVGSSLLYIDGLPTKFKKDSVLLVIFQEKYDFFIYNWEDSLVNQQFRDAG